MCSQTSYQARCHCLLDDGVWVGGGDLAITHQNISTCILTDVLCDMIDISSLDSDVAPLSMSFVPTHI